MNTLSLAASATVVGATEVATWACARRSAARDRGVRVATSVARTTAGPGRCPQDGRSRRRILAASLAVALSAQELYAASEDEDESDYTTKLPQVQVIGSRIRRADVETSQPVFVLEREQIERSGLASVGDLLQDLTAHGAALNTTFNNGGNGEIRVDLRDLGSDRTLVLLNGRRLSTTLDGAVDLTAIPLSIVERIEVLKDGASAIYGSDAIAGVINVQTRRDYVGAEAGAYVGENEEGDGRIESYDFTLGAAGERAAVAMNASYAKQEPIFAGDREISAVPTFGLPANSIEAFASATTPFGRFGFGPRGTCAFVASGVYPSTGCSDFSLSPPQEATTYDPATGGYRVFDRDTDGFNFAPDNYLQTPYERTSLYVQGRYDFSPSTAFAFEALYNERRSEQQLAAQPFSLAINALPPSRHVVPAGHVYNPFGQDVRRISFRPGGEFRFFRQDADTWRVGGGLDGAVEWFDRSFRWDLSALHAEQSVGELYTGQLNGQRLLLALGPSFRDGAGVARCGTPAAPLPDCVPLDAFHGPDGVSQDMLEYLYFTAQETTRSKLENYSANLTGDLYDLPAGPIGLALGYEYRRETAQYVPDGLLRFFAQGVGGSGAFQPIAGSTTADEVYVEVALPLLADLPLARTLELSLASRRSDYEAFGATTNSKVGLRWSPAESLLVRGNWSQGFRAPNLAELFSPPVRFLSAFRDFLGFFDLCVDAANPTPEVRANCIVDGVPGGSYEPVGTVFEVVVGGNPDLQPEDAIDRTLGVVWSPTWIEGLDLSLDWYRIEIAQAISGVGYDVLLNACAVQGVAEACDRTLRDPATGELQVVDARNLNSGTLQVEGYDLTVRYRFDSRYGLFDLIWDTAYYADYITEVPRSADPISVTGNHFGRNLAGWRIRSNLDLAWQRGDFGAAAGLRYYDDLDEACFGDSPTTAPVCSRPDFQSPTFGFQGENDIPSAWYLDLQASWNAPWNATLRLGVNNALDHDPPFSFISANSFDPAYPVPGRFWYASYSQKF